GADELPPPCFHNCQKDSPTYARFTRQILPELRHLTKLRPGKDSPMQDPGYQPYQSQYPPPPHRPVGFTRLSFAKTRSPLVSTAWEMGCNVVELGYMRPRRGILESGDILAKNKSSQRCQILSA